MENRKDIFGSLTGRIKGVIGGVCSTDDKLKNICVMLKEDIPYFDWVGFYLVDPEKSDELVLGPFAGKPTDHTRISFGTGICGQAAATGKTFVVQDVSKESNYLSCSIDVKSEIVIPIFKGEKLVGELDIDSHTPEPFTPEDEKFLEGICEGVAKLF